jgi:hypothetical protein
MPPPARWGYSRESMSPSAEMDDSTQISLRHPSLPSISPACPRQYPW